MEKLKFKNGEVSVITDIDEIVKATIDNCKENTSAQKRCIEKYLLKKKPDKCIVLAKKNKRDIIYRYMEKNGEKCYDVYNGYESPCTVYCWCDELFFEYYKTVNDDKRVNNILNKIKIGDEMFYHKQYSTVYKKITIEKIDVQIYLSRLVVSIKNNKKERIVLLNLNKNGYFEGIDGSTVYPSSFKQEIENKIMKNKKKRFESLERSINKLRKEIENGIIW